MTTPGAISWIGLLTLMVDGPDLPVRGVISSREGADPSYGYFGWAAFAGQPVPVFAGFSGAGEPEEPEAGEPDGPGSEGAEPGGSENAGGSTVPESVDADAEPVLTRAWRSGRRVRLERPDGRPSLIVGERSCWQFRGDDPVPVESPSSAVAYQGNGTQLLRRRKAGEFTGDDFTRPTGPVGQTTFLGRDAYTVELAPPAHKPFPIQLVVDGETGLVLQERNDGYGSVDEWAEIVVGEQLDDGLFRWQGPSRSEADERAEHEREWQADLAQRTDWFRANVTPLPLRLELDLSVHVHVYEPDGSFEASIGESHLGMLARRPSSGQDWQLGWSEVQHRWSSDGWDWALSIYDEAVTEAGLARLKQALGRT
ncbi:MAG TPA: hypothetical protein VF557_05715 [Jatrophihabitans sp.]|jgi:hypothetical protein|uniref:hypothetical protein n=1 Tax=Jatrophihabitans sp. TaxID=1932789 RepID=UPI002EFBD682